ncbi:hypothetical protein IMZ48_20515, partial [Candidatus Bathyarchaeota archaeon]|nr:hypothetical protein [Candidatus Bathyarchaeota archaeon]
MRAHLARHVSRRHLVHVARCPLPRVTRPRPTCYSHDTPVYVSRPFRRTFFGIFKDPPRRIKTPEWEPGWPLVIAWRSRTLEDLRPPPREELADAFRNLFQYKIQHQIPVNSTQALQCLRLFNYLVENKDDEDGAGLSIPELMAARDALLLVPRDSAKHHLEFSRALYGEIQRQRQLEEEYGVPEEPVDETHGLRERPADADFRCHFTALTQYGASTEAATALNEYWRKITAEERIFKGSKQLWMVLLQGLAREGKETELLEQARLAEECGIVYLPQFQQVMTIFFAKQDRVEEAKYWFEKDLGNRWPSLWTYS